MRTTFNFLEGSVEDIASLLFKYSAELSVCDKDGKTALMIAEEYGYEDIVKFLKGL